jgi:CO/xanthine dehydrogenase FAD-binding subunit
VKGVFSMDLEVLKEAYEDTKSSLTKDKLGKVSLTSLDEKNWKEKKIWENNRSLEEVKVDHIIHLIEENSKVKEYRLTVKVDNNRPFRVYEVENIVIGKPIQYLYKSTILNIIKNKILEYIPKESHCFNEEKIISIYKKKLDEALKISSRSKQ